MRCHDFFLVLKGILCWRIYFKPTIPLRMDLSVGSRRPKARQSSSRCRPLLLSVSEWFLVCVKAGRPSHLFPQSGGSNFDHVTRVDSVGFIGHSANLTAITYWSMKVGSVSLFFGAWKSKSLMHLLMELLLQRIILKNYNICFLLSRLEGGMKEIDLSALYDLEGGLLLSPVGARVLSYWFMRIYFFFFFDLGCSVPFTDRREDEGSWLA